MACVKDGQTLANAIPHHGDIAWPLKVGNRWRTQYLWQGDGQEYWEEYTVLAYEEVTVPAGTIMAYRIGLTDADYSGYYNEFWYAPAVQAEVKAIEWGDGSANSWAYVSELVSYELK